jgi:hypothetical protein
MPPNDNRNRDVRTKPWKSYFLEFVMIFLAVTLSFFAENFRDGMAETNDEREFIRSFVEDLKADTTTIGRILKARRLKMTALDSLTVLLQDKVVKGHEGQLYFFGRTLLRNTAFLPSSRTMSQLEYSGSLRLIENRQAADSIVLYQKGINGVLTSQEDERLERSGTQPFLTRIFDPFVFDKMLVREVVNRPAGNPALRSYDPDLFLDLAHQVHSIKGSNRLMNKRLGLLNARAIRLMSYLKAAYRLE